MEPIDLSSILTPEAIKRLKKAEKTKAKAAPTPEPSPPKPKPSPWIAEAAVLVETVVTCTCGTEYSVPASDAPLVRFRHRRRGDLWEVAQHPALLRPDLPRETRQIYGTCQVCPNCWQDTDVIEIELEDSTQH